jgi:hypothetical protein
MDDPTPITAEGKGWLTCPGIFVERLIKKLELDKEILADDGEEAAADGA